MTKKYDSIIDNMQEDIKDIKKDVKSLLRFKWQLMGGAAVIGAMLAVALSSIGIKLI